VALVTKNTFASGRVTDGVRKHLGKDFDKIFVLDLGGSIRDNEKLSGTTHNVFGIRVGVSINFFVRASNGPARSQPEIYYYKTDEFWTKHQKYHFLDGLAGSSQITWTTVPSSAKDWALTGVVSDFDLFFPLARPSEGNAIFDLHSNGLKSNRDQWVYNMSHDELARNIRRVMEFYNAQVARWKQSDKRTGIDSFVTYDDTSISWSRDLSWT
jgi:predicted helicase